MAYLGKETRFTWLGHATFLIETPGGSRVLLDPWLSTNPSCPKSFHEIDDIDLILVTHGHGDHIGDVMSVHERTGAKIVCNYELAHFFGKKGAKDICAMNKGGTVEEAGLLVTMVNAHHSSGIEDGDQMIYGGEPAGFVCETVENQFKFYIAGDTCVFGDMKLIGEMHEPTLGILPIGDCFTMGPREAAKAAHLLGVQVVVPCHYGTFDALHGTPEQFLSAVSTLDISVEVLEPGGSIE